MPKSPYTEKDKILLMKVNLKKKRKKEKLHLADKL